MLNKKDIGLLEVKPICEAGYKVMKALYPKEYPLSWKEEWKRLQNEINQKGEL